MIPLRDENPSSTVPVVTRLVVAVNCVVFLYEILLGPDLRQFTMTWGLVPQRLTAAFVTGEEPVTAGIATLFTSMFLHGGVAWWAHVGGFAFGWLAMHVVKRTDADRWIG